MTDTALTLPLYLELGAVVVAATVGALTAQERKLDYLGGVGLGIACALGGGLTRDVIMQVGSVYMLESPYAIPFAVVTSLVAYFFYGLFRDSDRVIEWLDIISVGLFAVAGCDKAIVYHLSPAAAIMMGLLTANGGGLMRDVLLGDVPRIFQKSNYYALCGLVGAAAYWAIVSPLGMSKIVAAVTSVVACVGLRRASLHFGLQSPAGVDLAPKVVEPVRKATRAARRQAVRKAAAIRRRQLDNDVRVREPRGRR